MNERTNADRLEADLVQPDGDGASWPSDLLQAALGLEPSPRMAGREAVRPAPVSRSMDGVIVGRIDGWSDDGRALVDFPERRGAGPIVARSIVPLDAEDLGAEVLLTFERGDCSAPIVLGLLQPATGGAPPRRRGGLDLGSLFDVREEGQRVVIAARRDVQIECGRTSIVLTRAGKLLLKAAYLLSRSSGVNRIRGGSVQIN